MKLQHLRAYLNNARARAKRDKVPFNLTIEYLETIAADECPIFHSKFVWGASGLGKGKTRDDTPQLDKIIPELGYVVGNVAFISGKANKMKDNGTMQEHYDIADWIWNHIHAKENTATPIPTGSNHQGGYDAKRRALLAARLGEDRDDANYHSGTIPGQNADHSAQESSGDSVGYRAEEVGTFITSYDSQMYGDTNPTLTRTLEFNRYINNQLRERIMVDGAESKISKSSD